VTVDVTAYLSELAPSNVLPHVLMGEEVVVLPNVDGGDEK
jgi:hypothetical protein